MDIENFLEFLSEAVLDDERVLGTTKDRWNILVVDFENGDSIRVELSTNL